MKKLIHDKLITDFTAMVFADGGASLFDQVEKMFISNMGPQDCLIIQGDPSEIIVGNTSTDRVYTFSSVIIENMESADTQAILDNKVDRLSNIEDVILNYLEKEPGNLNAWGQLQTPIINIYKTRVGSARYDYQEMDTGLSVALTIPFSVYVTITPQLL